jgi:hypothetical protein
MTAGPRTIRLSHRRKRFGIILTILLTLGVSRAGVAETAASPQPAPAPDPHAGPMVPAGGSQAIAHPETTTPQKTTIEELMVRAKRLDPTLDFWELRRMHVSKPDFRVSAYISPQYKIAIDNLEASVGKADAAAIRKQCDAAFKIYFIESKAHALCGLALDKAGDKEGAEYERYLSQGMVSSILATGDGKTWKTAYEVFAVSEEYDVLFAAGLEKTQQGTLDGTTKDGKTKAFDVITAKDPQTGAEQRIFFNVTELYTRYGNLEEKKAMEHK